MKQLHTLFSRFLCIFCASFVLVGCSYFDTGEEAMLQTEKPAESIEFQEEMTVKPQPVDVREAVARSTDGRVQLFGFDDPAPISAYKPVFARQSGAMEVAPAPAVPVASVGQPPGPRLPVVYSGDPSVQIFPFDDGVFAPAAAPPPSVEQPAKHEEYVSLADAKGDRIIVYFNHDSARLSQDALAKIAGVANSFNNAAGLGLTVEGHASVKANYNDEAQRRIVNLKISMDRAFAVASELINQGIPAEAIRVMAWGDAQPPRSMNGKTQEEAARRVEISG